MARPSGPPASVTTRPAGRCATGGAVAGSGTSVRAGAAVAAGWARAGAGVPAGPVPGAAVWQAATAASTMLSMAVRPARECNTAHSVRIPAAAARLQRPALRNR